LRILIRRRAALIVVLGALALSAILLAGFYVSAAPDLPPITRAMPGPDEVVRVDRERRAPEYVEGEIIVKLRPTLRMASGMDAATEEFRALNMELGAKIVGSAHVGPDSEIFLVRIPAGVDVGEAIMTYGARKLIEYAEPNYLWYPEAPVIPNDPHFWRLWGMRNYGQDFYPGVFWEKGIPGCDIGATEAWDVRTDASSVLVAVIDTGIDVDHLDLTNNIWRNPGEIPGNGIDDDGNGFIDDVYGWDFANDDNTVFDSQSADRHGTHVAGTIGAEGNNGRGVAGVAWKAQIMSCKFIHGQSGSTWDAIDAINYASMMGAKIASNSWGGGGESQALREAIANSGMLFIASAGNSAENTDIYPHYPSSYDCPNLISVAASDWNDNLVNFSCYGLESVDLAAPGHWIISAYAAAGYIWMGGTSMATPHVSGAAALVAAEYPDMPLYPGAEGWSEGDITVKDALLASVDVNPAFVGKMTTGGRLNVANAVKLEFPVRITSASADVTFGAAPLAAEFSAEVEYPSAVDHAWWSFGDGSDDAAGYTATHTYAEEGAYLAWFHAVTCDGVESTWPVQVVVADPGTIILVDDDGGFSFEDYFLFACEQAGLDYVVVDSRYPLGLPDDFNDRMLVWNTSFSWSDTLLLDQEDYLARFLDNGGRLLMISPEYLYDLALTPFAWDYLHVWDYGDNVPMGHWDGIDGDVITDGMSFDGDIGFGLEDALWPDINARPILKNEDYGEEIWPALRYADENQRLVFTTVPWEELPIFDPGDDGDPTNPNPNNSAYFLAKVYNYLMGPINRPPTIDRMEADIYFAQVGEEITFTAEAHDADGDSLTYLWLFDDPSEPTDPLVGSTVTMAFDEPGAYAALLIVIDERGEWRKGVIAVTVANPGSVLFVDDDDSDDDTEYYFFDAFDAIGQEYLAVPNIVMTGQYCGLTGLERFLVVWNCGELGGLSEPEQATVAEFLSQGGRLFLAGQEVMFGLDKSDNGRAFARDFLHVAGVEHDVGTAYVTGFEGDPVTGGAGQVDLTFPWGFDDWTDSLELAPEATAIFLNDNDKPCALRYTGDDHRLVFLAVAFEAFPLELAPEAYRAAGVGPHNGVLPFDAGALLGNVIEWIAEPIVTVTSPIADQICAEPTVIAWEAVDYAGAELAIDIDYSMDDGITWHAIATDEANDGSYLWDVTKLSESGPCVIRVTASRPDEISGSGLSARFNVLVNLGVIVFVDDDDSDDDTEGYFIDALDAIGAEHIVTPSGSIMGEGGAKPGLEMYRVVWNCGEHGSLSELEQAAIAEFLGRGGRLFLAGQQIMSGLAGSGEVADFARNYLHVTGVELDAGTAYVTGVAGDPVTGGAGKIDLAFPEDFDDLTDVLTIAPEATAILLTDKGKPCALRYTSDNHRLVFMGVAFEAFTLAPAPEADKAPGAANGVPPFDAGALLESVLEWIDTPVVIVTKPVQGQVYTGSTLVGWTASDFTGMGLAIKIECSPDDGNTWATLATNEANDGSYLWDLTRLSRGGQYVVRVTASRPDSVSSSGVSKPFIVSVVGANNFVVGPNPASDSVNFYINASGEATMYVYDVAGRQVFSQKIESGQTCFEWHLVNKAGKPLANGLYLCYMVTADGVRTDITRLVISR